MLQVLRTGSVFAWAVALALVTACKKEETAPAGLAASGSAPTPAIKADKGVDVAAKTLYVGALNDESGPAAAIGKPYAAGKRLLARVVNAGGSGLLPPGWKIELVEKDHGYNPQQSVQHFNAIKDQVLFVATSFGTPNTLPLRDLLSRETIVAFPASLSSEMARHEHTPPLGTSYQLEAMRAMDFAVQHAGAADKVKAGIVYQQDDYGKDGHEGWRAAAAHHKVAIVSEQTVAPGQKDFAAVVTSLKKAGANYVLLTTLPSATGPILGTAAQLQYQPLWIGNTPSWIDRFADPKVLPPPVLATFHWVTGMTYWGEKVPGMDKNLAAYEKHGRDLGPPDFYLMGSYVQGLIELEVFRRALEAKDVTRAGFKKALATIKSWDAGGMIQPIDLSQFPYVTSTRSRVLKPAAGETRWTVVADWAEPQTLAAK